MQRRILAKWVLVCSVSFCLVLAAKAVAVELRAMGQSSKSGESSAKIDYALIYGTVWGADDHPKAGVPVSIRRAGDRKPKWELVSDRRGEFAQRVPIGERDYIVQADIKTPKGQPKPEITVHIDGNERKDVAIHLSK
jgi:hypothetical protein